MRKIRFIIDIAIPALLAYLAADDAVINWLINNHLLSQYFDVVLFQKFCLLANIVFTTFEINIRLYYHKYREEQCQKEIAGLYSIIKQFALSNFVAITQSDEFSFDLRIFVPEVNVVQIIQSLVSKKECEKWFVIQNIEPFAKKDITEHLRFRVDPDPQGLVGEAYTSGAIVYDDILPLTNSTQYALDRSQLSRTSNLRWSICVPVINNSNEVIAVIAFDSDRSYLDIKQNKQEITTLTNTLSIMMRDSVPVLFKKNWRLF